MVVKDMDNKDASKGTIASSIVDAVTILVIGFLVYAERISGEVGIAMIGLVSGAWAINNLRGMTGKGGIKTGLIMAFGSSLMEAMKNAKHVWTVLSILALSTLVGCGHGQDVWKVVRSACGVALAISPTGEVVGPGQVEELPEIEARQVAGASEQIIGIGAAE